MPAPSYMRKAPLYYRHWSLGYLRKAPPYYSQSIAIGPWARFNNLRKAPPYYSQSIEIGPWARFNDLRKAPPYYSQSTEIGPWARFMPLALLIFNVPAPSWSVFDLRMCTNKYFGRPFSVNCSPLAL